MRYVALYIIVSFLFVIQIIYAENNIKEFRIDTASIRKTYFNEVVAYKLPNSMKVILIKKSSAPVVSCRIAYKVGSRFEETGYTGISHMLEHMMFKGTKRLGTKNFKLDSIIWAQIDLIYPKLVYYKNINDSLKCIYYKDK